MKQINHALEVCSGRLLWCRVTVKTGLITIKQVQNAYLYLLNEITAYKNIKAALLFLISPTLSSISLASQSVFFCTLSD